MCSSLSGSRWIEDDVEDWRAVSRQAIWDHYRCQPGSVLSRPAALGATAYSRKSYFFAEQLKIEPGETAGAMVDAALGSAQAPRGGFPTRTPWIVLLAIGIVSEALILVHPLLLLPGFIAAYVAMMRLRRANFAIYDARDHQRFAAEVELYARAVAESENQLLTD
jgi:hypothetical protein